VVGNVCYQQNFACPLSPLHCDFPSLLKEVSIGSRCIQYTVINFKVGMRGRESENQFIQVLPCEWGKQKITL
jgi:hypothetical protein